MSVTLMTFVYNAGPKVQLLLLLLFPGKSQTTPRPKRFIPIQRFTIGSFFISRPCERWSLRIFPIRDRPTEVSSGREEFAGYL